MFIDSVFCAIIKPTNIISSNFFIKFSNKIIINLIRTYHIKVINSYGIIKTTKFYKNYCNFNNINNICKLESMKKLIFCIMLSYSFSNIILIPNDYDSIQDGIDVAIDGDTLLVASGTYYENINFGSKIISVIGEDNESTIINGNYNGSVVIFNGSGLSEALLSGFTITHGSAYDGGGIYCSSASPIIQNNIITENISSTYGGGISCNYSSAKIINNIITHNTAQYGGGISFDRYTSSIIQNNTIVNNEAVDGGGIGCFVFSSPLINNNTIANNSANSTGGGIYCYYASSAIINNTIIWNNISPCIDSGDPDSELDPDFTRADIGANYFHQVALGDINNDHIIDILDIILLVSFILGEPADEYEYITADLNQDNVLNILDIVILIDIILYTVLPEGCFTIPEVGPCDGICPTYYFNQETFQCEEFITGCCGIEVLDTIEDCQNACE